MRTPDDHIRLELSKFKAPEVTTPDLKNEQINTLGKHRIMFAVDDIKDTVARLHTHGAELVGEIVQYKDMYLLCYLRGPEGIMLALAEEIGTRRK
jgi:predicted enzyme related to lactoylglutathione lyase